MSYSSPVPDTAVGPAVATAPGAPVLPQAAGRRRRKLKNGRGGKRRRVKAGRGGKRRVKRGRRKVPKV